jgi:predicted small secreted protein
MTKILALILFAVSLSGCGTIAGIASDVNSFTNQPRPYYWVPPGQRNCWGRHGRRWCR